MFNFFKRDPKTAPSQTEEPNKLPEETFFTRIKSGLAKTRQSFTQGFNQLFSTRSMIDPLFFEELETLLLSHDLGLQSTEAILKRLERQLKKQTNPEPKYIKDELKQIMTELLQPLEQAFHPDEGLHPNVILVVGVNGAGKTTTIGKLAHFYKSAKFKSYVGRRRYVQSRRQRTITNLG